MINAESLAQSRPASTNPVAGPHGVAIHLCRFLGSCASLVRVVGPLGHLPI